MKNNIEQQLKKFQLKQPPAGLRQKIFAAVAEATAPETITLADRIWSSHLIRYAACAIFVITLLFNIFIAGPQQKNLTRLYANEHRPNKETRELEFFKDIIAELNGNGAYFMARLNMMKLRDSTRDRYLKIRQDKSDILYNYM